MKGHSFHQWVLHPSMASSHKSLTASGSTQRIFATHVAGTPVFELRYLMVGSLSLSADQNGLGSRIMNGIDQYLEFYWDRFDAICPIVHKSSFSSKSSPAHVVATMTAIGAQYAPSSEARQLAVAVHKRCQDYIAEVSLPSYRLSVATNSPAARPNHQPISFTGHTMRHPSRSLCKVQIETYRRQAIVAV